MLGEIQSTTLSIDPWSVIAAICLLITVVVGFDKFHDAGKNLKDKFVDRKFNKMVERAESGDTTLREEFRTMFNETHKEHDEFTKRLDFQQTCLKNDKLAIERHDREIQEMREDIKRVDERVDDRTEEGTLMIKSAKAILNNQLGLSDTSNIVDVVEEIDAFLIERRG